MEPQVHRFTRSVCIRFQLRRLSAVGRSAADLSALRQPRLVPRATSAARLALLLRRAVRVALLRAAMSPLPPTAAAARRRTTETLLRVLRSEQLPTLRRQRHPLPAQRRELHGAADGQWPAGGAGQPGRLMDRRILGISGGKWLYNCVTRSRGNDWVSDELVAGWRIANRGQGQQSIFIVLRLYFNRQVDGMFQRIYKSNVLTR